MKHGPALMALLLASCGTPPPPTDPELREKVDRGAARLLEGSPNSGLVVGWLRGGTPAVLGYGRISEANPAPPDGDTMFEIGSVTKTFTALLLLQETKAGRFRLEEPIDSAIPKGVRCPSRNGKAITYLDLATHRSGLPSIPENLDPRDSLNPYADYTENDLFDALDAVELTRDPGERYEYSNLGVGLLGQILARENKKSYETLVLERICTPLGLKDTRITLNDDQKRRLAPGHDASGRPVPNWDFQALAGAGAIRSTANDLLKYLEAQFGDACLGAHLPKATIGEGLSIGLAWHLSSAKNFQVVWHNGGTGGYRCWAGFVPDTRTAVVVLANSAVDVDLLGFTLVSLLQDVE